MQTTIIEGCGCFENRDVDLLHKTVLSRNITSCTTHDGNHSIHVPKPFTYQLSNDSPLLNAQHYWDIQGLVSRCRYIMLPGGVWCWMLSAYICQWSSTIKPMPCPLYDKAALSLCLCCVSCTNNPKLITPYLSLGISSCYIMLQLLHL